MTGKNNKPSFHKIPVYFDDNSTRDNFLIAMHLQKLIAKAKTEPLVNIANIKGGYVLELAVPGMELSDFYIGIENEVLTIAVPPSKNILAGNFAYQEYNYQSFKRAFFLPKIIDDISKVTINYNNGILRLIIPQKKSSLNFGPEKLN